MRGLLGGRPFDLPLDVGGATLLTGANGTGKSTVLRAIDAFGRGAWKTLAGLPFDGLTLEFIDDTSVQVDKVDDGLLTISNGAESWTHNPQTYSSPIWSRVAEWTTASFEDVQVVAAPEITLSPYSEVEPIAAKQSKYIPSLSRESTPEWLSQITDRLSVLFITDQRLVVEDRPRGTKDRSTQAVSAAVTAYAEDLRDRVGSALSDYGVRAQALDRAFPNTVLKAMRQPGKEGGRRGAVEALRRVEQKRETLQSAGLVQIDEPQPALEKELTQGEIAFVRTYADFALQKYEALDPLLRRVTAFTQFLNARYAGKEIRIQRDDGFVVALDDDTRLAPALLSSGEQQMLVLAYQIIFLAAPNTLVLIDEPELSLHVSWQSSLVDDLVNMGAASGLSFLLATHSPTLIGGRRGQRRSLDHKLA